MSLTKLTDSLLQTIYSYLDAYHQTVFLVLNSEFVRLGEEISIVNITFEKFLKNLRSKRWTSIVNGYNRIDFNFYDKIEKFRGWIIRSYEKRVKEEAREGRQLPPPSERLYEMVIEMWPFTSLQNLSIDLKSAVALLEKNTLKKLQKLTLSCDRYLGKKEVVSSLVQLFNVLRKNRLELKDLHIFRNGGDFSDDDDEHISSMPRFPFFSYVDGLRTLIIQSFVIVENPGDGFKFLKRLELDCILQCDLCHFDGVGSLTLRDCKGIKGLSALKITRHVHVYGEFHPNDEYSTASSLELTTAEEGFDPTIDLAQYERAHSLHLTWGYSKVIVPEKLSNNLKSLSVHGFVPFKDHLPPNNLRYLEFRNSRLEYQIYQIPNLSNVQQVRLVSCELTSLEILGSGIKDIAVSFCHLEDYSPLGRSEKVLIESCDIPHTLKFSEVKELTIRNCKFTFNEESSDGSFVPFLSDCPKLEVLDVDFSYFDRYDMIASEFPSLKKIVLKGVDAESVDVDVFPFPGFWKCWMPQESRYSGIEITYLLRE